MLASRSTHLAGRTVARITATPKPASVQSIKAPHASLLVHTPLRLLVTTVGTENPSLATEPTSAPDMTTTAHPKTMIPLVLKQLTKFEQHLNEFPVPPRSDAEIMKAVPIWYRPFLKPSDVRLVLANDFCSLELKERLQTSMMLRWYMEKHANRVGIQSADILYTKVRQHLQDPKLYEMMGLDQTQFISEFYLWAIHLWMVYRRLRFEKVGGIGDFISNVISQQLWLYVEQKVIEMKVNSFLISKRVKEHEEVFYSLLVRFDYALHENSDIDPLFCTALWSFIYGDERPVTAEQLFKIVRYMRFHKALFDNMDSKLLLMGIFKFTSPGDPIFDEISAEQLDLSQQ